MKSDEKKDLTMNEAGDYPGPENDVGTDADSEVAAEMPSDEEGVLAGGEIPSQEEEYDEEGFDEEDDGTFVELEDPIRKELETLRDDLARAQDQHLRLAADFENYRKRVNADLSSGWVRAQAELAGSLLEGLDDLQRVSQFTTEDATLDILIEGVDLVERKFLKALTGAGLEAFVPTGEVFDPNTMEAMMRVHTEEDGQEGTVHQVFQKGYRFKEQLVRPARVSVYSDDD